MEDKVFQWLVDYCSGKSGSRETAALREWLDASVKNRETFEEYLRIIELHRMIEGEERIDQERSWDRLYVKLQGRKKLYRVLRRWAVAASILILVGIGVSIVSEDRSLEDVSLVAEIFPGSTKATLVLSSGERIDLADNELQEVKEQGILVRNDSVEGLRYELTDFVCQEPVFHTVEVPTAGEYHFTLPDGTKVWINSESELTFPMSFTGPRREVFVKGEVYFEVEHDETHPFVVHANEVAVQVLGTKFNVAAYNDDNHVITTLLQGAVQLAYAEHQQLLRPGDQVIADLNDQTIRTEKVDAVRYASWIKGVFEYENMSLGEIAIQLARWYGVEFVFPRSEFKERRFTGVVKKYDMLKDVLKIIEMTTNVCFVVNEKEIVVQEAVRRSFT